MATFKVNVPAKTTITQAGVKFQELTRALNRWEKVRARAEKAEEALVAARAAADDLTALAASVKDGTQAPARTQPEREADLADAERMARAARRACTQELDEVADVVTERAGEMLRELAASERTCLDDIESARDAMVSAVERLQEVRSLAAWVEGTRDGGGQWDPAQLSVRLPIWRAAPILVDDVDIRRSGSTRPFPAPQVIAHLAKYLTGELRLRSQARREPSVAERLAMEPSEPTIEDGEPAVSPEGTEERAQALASGAAYRAKVARLREGSAA